MAITMAMTITMAMVITIGMAITMTMAITMEMVPDRKRSLRAIRNNYCLELLVDWLFHLEHRLYLLRLALQVQE